MSVTKYKTFSAAPVTSHGKVLNHVHPGTAVLEFGCATGYMSKFLKEELGCTVTGVEYMAAAGELAREYCKRVIIGDAEQVDYRGEFGEERFDAVLFADVLEHLRAPESVLQLIRPFIAPGGAVIASIPNIAHGDVRLALLAGEFRYRDLGLLDDTHVRLFTKETIQEMFESAGYLVTSWDRTRLEVGHSELGLTQKPLPAGVVQWVAAQPEATTYQFIVRAVPTDASYEIHDLRKQLATRDQGTSWLRRMQSAAWELAGVCPVGSKIILADENQFGGALVYDRVVLPFLERDGVYYGAPPDDATALSEFERLRGEGAEFMAYAWPAFWFLDHYPGLTQHLRNRFKIVVDNERLVVFNIRGD